MQCSITTKKKHKFECPAEWKTPDDDHENCYFCLYTQGKSTDSSSMVKPVLRILKNKVNQVNQAAKKPKVKDSIADRKARLTYKKSLVPKTKPTSNEQPVDQNPIVRVKRKRGKLRKKSLDQEGDPDFKPNTSMTSYQLFESPPERKSGKRAKFSTYSNSDSALEHSAPTERHSTIEMANESLHLTDRECPELNLDEVNHRSSIFAVTCPTLNVQKDLDELAINLVGARRKQTERNNL